MSTAAGLNGGTTDYTVEAVAPEREREEEEIRGGGESYIWIFLANHEMTHDMLTGLPCKTIGRVLVKSYQATWHSSDPHDDEGHTAK